LRRKEIYKLHKMCKYNKRVVRHKLKSQDWVWNDFWD